MLKLRSTAPAIVPVATYGADGLQRKNETSGTCSKASSRCAGESLHCTVLTRRRRSRISARFSQAAPWPPCKEAAFAGLARRAHSYNCAELRAPIRQSSVPGFLLFGPTSG